jgi:flagellar basal body-associated protein FliL
MAESKPEAAASKDAKDGGAPAKGPNPIVTMVLVAIVAGGASFGGVKLGGAAHHGVEAPKHSGNVMKPPGPTVPLEAFILSIPDASARPHAMKVTIAVELEAAAKEEATKAFIPRVRDATLAYLRSLTYEEAASPVRMEKARSELLERYRTVGLPGAERILITDLVVQ